MAPKATAKSKSDQNTITFTLERETKGTNRYSEDVADGAEGFIGTLYLRKSHPLSGEPNLTLTLSA
jgi:hypothetical protein